MASKIVVNLDTSKENYIVAKCKQNDDLTLEAFIYENGEPLDLTNKEITIQALKADNTYVIQNTDIVKEENKINSNLVRDFSRVPGTTKIEVVLTESSKQNTTFSFYLEVVGSVIRGAVESSDSITALEKVQDAAIEIKKINQETQTIVENAGAASKEDFNKVNTQLEKKATKVDIAKISNGTPLFASSISGMTDITKNYVNTTDGYLYVYSGESWTNSMVLYQSTGVNINGIGMKELNDNMLEETELVTFIFDNDDNVFGVPKNLVVMNYPISEEGYITINLKAKSAGVIILEHFRKIGESFTLKDKQEVNLNVGVQKIKTNFYSTGDSNDYVGFQNINECITFGAYRGSIGYYNTIPSDYVNIGETISPVKKTDATFSFYPTISNFKKQKISIKEEDIVQGSITISKLDTSLFKRYDISYTDVDNSNGTFGGWYNTTLVADYPINKKGMVGLEIKSLKEVKKLPIFLVNKNEDIYTITDVRYVDIKVGFNSITTDMVSDGSGTDYIALKNISTEMVAYDSSNKLGYYTAPTTDIVNGEVIDPTKRNDATLCFKPFIVSDELFVKTRWSDKKINCLGDSLTFGDIVGNGTRGIPWTTYLNSLIKPSVINNYGIGGTNLGGTSSNAMVNRFSTMEDGADLITVWGGTNDFCNGVELGVLGDTTTSTFYGSLDVLIKGLYEKYPNAEICFITPPKINKVGLGETNTPNSRGKLLIDYRNAVIESCDKYSVPVLDMYTYGSMCPYLDNGTYRPDRLHYSNAGYERLAYKIMSFINNL